MLSKEQFEVLVHLVDLQGDVATIVEQEVINELKEKGFVDDSCKITEEGLKELEPYRARRVIFLAAGLGTRLRPATINVPKPMVRVKGKPIICYGIEAALAIGIEEIYIVRGYLGECFEQLISKYPQVTLVDNPEYITANNISSAMRINHLIQNAYIMEADLLINNPALFKKYNYTSNCLGVPVKETEDWCVISENGVAKQLVKGGKNCHHLFSMYYITEEEGKNLSKQLEEIFQSEGGRDMFWDMIPMNIYNEEYNIVVRECTFDDVSEIDTYEELQMLDSDYKI